MKIKVKILVLVLVFISVSQTFSNYITASTERDYNLNGGLPAAIMDKNTNYTPHSPLKIVTNDELLAIAKTENWPGNGSIDSPIVISGLNFTGPFPNNTYSSEYQIQIIRTNLSLEITNCLFTRTAIPLMIHYSQNIRISDNIIFDNY
ncbi:MAG: hypothetical protein ACFFFG_16985, partial [Candidatus Thorarchaeota archaeon]